MKPISILLLFFYLVSASTAMIRFALFSHWTAGLCVAFVFLFFFSPSLVHDHIGFVFFSLLFASLRSFPNSHISIRSWVGGRETSMRLCWIGCQRNRHCVFHVINDLLLIFHLHKMRGSIEAWSECHSMHLHVVIPPATHAQNECLIRIGGRWRYVNHRWRWPINQSSQCLHRSHSKWPKCLSVSTDRWVEWVLCDGKCGIPCISAENSADPLPISRAFNRKRWQQ